jgi:hypothetical protein
MDAGLAADHPVTIAAKMLREELLQVKADQERELGKLSLTCRDRGMDVYWVQGIAYPIQALGACTSSATRTTVDLEAGGVSWPGSMP